MKNPDALHVRRGERVRIKSAAEIAATLDEHGDLDKLPFMPELLALSGRTFTVRARADKTCDTIEKTNCTRRMHDTIHLEGARCDGSAHGGCQKGCLLFFKEGWLERVAEDAPDVDPGPVPPELVETLQRNAKVGENFYRCQDTQLLEATEHLTGYTHYLDDLRDRNVPLRKFVRAMPWMLFNKFQRFSQVKLPPKLRIAGGRKFPHLKGKVTGKLPPEIPLNLRPGELVEVKSKAEIEATLDGNQRHRGMWFDEEMTEFFGRHGRVTRRVGRLIDEKTGRMLTLKKDCIVVEDFGCQGLYHNLCPRSCEAFWRESWLRRAEPEPASPTPEVPVGNL